MQTRRVERARTSSTTCKKCGRPVRNTSSSSLGMVVSPQLRNLLQPWLFKTRFSLGPSLDGQLYALPRSPYTTFDFVQQVRHVFFCAFQLSDAWTFIADR